MLVFSNIKTNISIKLTYNKCKKLQQKNYKTYYENFKHKQQRNGY